MDSYFGLAVILALVGWSRAKLNRDSAALRYANTAVYPFYIVHQTITILLGYAWLGWDVPFAVKFPALFAGTFLGSWTLLRGCAPHSRHARALRHEAVTAGALSRGDAVGRSVPPHPDPLPRGERTARDRLRILPEP